MSKFKGTPGPWVVRESSLSVSVVGLNGEAVFHESDKRIPGVMGDARLIAAAPKLLDAAIMAIEHYDAYFGGSAPDDLPWVPVMREAIKEALGEDAP